MGCSRSIMSSPKEIYHIIREIGNKKNVCHSFLIRSTESNKEYAYKVMDAKALSNSERKKILNHFEILKKINHPNIILLKYGGYSKDSKILYEISEYVDGGDLQTKLNEQKQKKEYFEENTLLDWFIQICLALKHLHSNNILHRDIKPSNIFLIKENIAKLGNFGVAKELKSGLNYAKSKVSTPQYLAPEIIENKKYTNKADIWCLGLTFYQLIILDYPFEGITDEDKQKNILEGNKKGIPDDCNIDKKFIEIINEMLSIKEDERPSINEILENGIIRTRTESYLTEKKFSFADSEKNIKEYENQVEQEESRKIYVEEDNEIKEFDMEEQNKIKEINDKIKTEKAKYDFHRQMSLMAVEILKKSSTFSTKK